MKEYFECDRCGDEKPFPEDLNRFLNALLCDKCLHIRNFDDSNPILYPTSE